MSKVLFDDLPQEIEYALIHRGLKPDQALIDKLTKEFRDSKNPVLQDVTNWLDKNET